MYLLHIINKKITNNIDSTIHLLTRKTQNKLKKSELLLIFFFVKLFVVVREFVFFMRESVSSGSWLIWGELRSQWFLRRRQGRGLAGLSRRNRRSPVKTIANWLKIQGEGSAFDIFPKIQGRRYHGNTKISWEGTHFFTLKVFQKL